MSRRNGRPARRKSRSSSSRTPELVQCSQPGDDLVPTGWHWGRHTSRKHNPAQQPVQFRAAAEFVQTLVLRGVHAMRPSSTRESTCRASGVCRRSRPRHSSRRFRSSRSTLRTSNVVNRSIVSSAASSC